MAPKTKRSSGYSTPLGPATPRSKGKINLTFQLEKDGGTITDDDRNGALVFRIKGSDTVVDAHTGAILGQFDGKSRSRCCCGGSPETYVGSAEQIQRQDQHVTVKAKSRGASSKYRLYRGDNRIGAITGSPKKLKVELDGNTVAKISYKTKVGNSYKGTFDIEILEAGVDLALICLLCFPIKAFFMANSRTRTVKYW